MIPSIHLQRNIHHLGQKDRAVYTLVACSISLQTLVCVYAFPPVKEDGRHIISLHRIYKISSDLLPPREMRRCCWADLAGFPKRETLGCLIGCACSSSFTVSKAAIDLTCSS